MSSVCFYFHVHQPRRVRKYRHFDIGNVEDYFNDDSDTSLNNEFIIKKVSQKCYLPTNKILLDLLNKHPEFRVSFSITGIIIEQFEEYAPETLESFIKLVDTGRVEIITETYYHSLSFLYSPKEFNKQISLQNRKIKEIFGVTPKVFRNTELIYNNDIAKEAEKMGYNGILTEGADHILDWRSPNFVYKPKNGNIGMLLKNYKLSDDIAFRFSSRDWDDYPLTIPKFTAWINKVNGNGEVVNLFMDYETFGEHQWEDTGIFEFLYGLPEELLKHPDNDFVTPSEALERYNPVSELDIPDYISWADVERDLSAWRSNAMQHDAMTKIYSLEDKVLATKNKALIQDWRRMTASDHFYYMCTKWFADGDVHKYFSPYDSPYDAFRYYMNALNDLKLRVDNHVDRP